MYRNAILRKYPDSVECMLYKHPFTIGDKTTIVRTQAKRNFEFNENGNLYSPRGRSLTHLLNTLDQSARRAINTAFELVKANKWDFFATFTVDPNRFGTDTTVRKHMWRKFRDTLTKKFPSLIIFAVPELHTGKRSNVSFFQGKNSNRDTIHFHALIGLNGVVADDFMSFALTPATYNKTLKSRKYDLINGIIHLKSGQPLYNCKRWRNGFSTFVKIADTDDDRKRVANYIVKYFQKDFKSVRYGEKRYFVTRNAIRPIRQSILVHNLSDFFLSLSDNIRKVTDRYIVLDSSNALDLYIVYNEEFTYQRLKDTVNLSHFPTDDPKFKRFCDEFDRVDYDLKSAYLFAKHKLEDDEALNRWLGQDSPPRSNYPLLCDANDGF